MVPQLTLDPNSEFPSLGRSNLVKLLGTWHPEMKKAGLFLDSWIMVFMIYVGYIYIYDYHVCLFNDHDLC